MNVLKTVFRKLWLLTLVLGWWLTLDGLAWAKPAKKAVVEESSNAGGWVFPYFLVVLSIGLGMLVVCRTSRRSDRARPEKYENLTPTK
ncbi:MAG: hypothetical protein JW888_01560 [Pirellulales bacterium]|nr:hypothetical protein [Pirellulales bacterium]